MEEKKFTEKESIELISQMINSTKKGLEVGSGNIFLYYGYTSLAIAAATYLTTYFTGINLWNTLWFLMFLPMIVIRAREQKKQTAVTTYTDRMLENIWKIVALLMIFSLIIIFIYGILEKSFHFLPMMPLALILVCVGTMITGQVINEKNVTAVAMAGFIAPVALLIDMVSGSYSYEPYWNIVAGLSFLFSLVIPGHILNRKSRKS